MRFLKNFPHFKQTNSSDCGPTSLRIIARHYGLDYSTEMLRKHCHITRSGVNLLGISEAAEYVGFGTAGGRVTVEQLAGGGVVPCILRWSQSHFVVCYGIEECKNGGFKRHISDPASQRLTYTKDEFERCWIGPQADENSNGVALMLEPGDDFGKIEDEYRKNSRSMLQYSVNSNVIV